MATDATETTQAAARRALSTRQQEALDLLATLERTAAFVRGCLARSLAEEIGLLPDEAALLVELDAAPEQRLRMADASRSLGVSKSGVTRLVDRMEERGLLERAACPRDRRVTYVGLTAAGRDTLARAMPVLASAAETHLAGRLGAAELHAVLAGLRKVVGAEAPV